MMEEAVEAAMMEEAVEAAMMEEAVEAVAIVVGVIVSGDWLI